MHVWIPEDDIVAFYLARYEDKSEVESIPYSLSEIATKIGTSTEGLKLRMDNFAALDSDGWADHYALLSQAVYCEYYDVGKEDHRAEVMKILKSTSAP